jgi:lipopolysaccharide transport system permease protein
MWRDLKVRYKQAVIGLGWAVIKPLMLMVVFVVVFGIIARVPTGNMPYSVVVYTGLLPWTLVTTVVGTAASSLIANAHLLTRVYFPRLIVPLSASIVALIDLIISLPILFGLLLWFHIPITARVLWLPLFLGMIFILSVSVGLIMAALHTKYHDVGMLLPILLQVWMYATPIIYPIELVPAKWLFVYSLNPLVGLIQGVRWALVDASIPTPFTMISSVVITLITLVGSVLFFQFAEDYFADVV